MFFLFVTLLGSLEKYHLRNTSLSGVWVDLAPLLWAKYSQPWLFWLLSSPSRQLLFYFNLSPLECFRIWDNYRVTQCIENCTNSTFSFLLTLRLTETILTSLSSCFPIRFEIAHQRKTTEKRLMTIWCLPALKRYLTTGFHNYLTIPTAYPSCKVSVFPQEYYTWRKYLLSHNCAI